MPLRPELVAILRRHRIAHPKGPNGQFFWGERGPMLSDSTCRSMLKRARKEAFAAEEQASPVAKAPYDFRHACITRWLNALVPVADVAKWSGNSPAIIHRKYEHCVAAQMKRLQALIEAADREATVPIDTGEIVAVSSRGRWPLLSRASPPTRRILICFVGRCCPELETLVS